MHLFPGGSDGDRLTSVAIGIGCGVFLISLIAIVVCVVWRKKSKSNGITYARPQTATAPVSTINPAYKDPSVNPPDTVNYEEIDDYIRVATPPSSIHEGDGVVDDQDASSSTFGVIPLTALYDNNQEEPAVL